MCKLSILYVFIYSYPLLNVPLPGNIPTVVNINMNNKNINTLDCGTKNCPMKGKMLIIK